MKQSPDKAGSALFFPLNRVDKPYNKGFTPLEMGCRVQPRVSDEKRCKASSSLTGFTLIELMVSVSIFLFLGIMLVSVFKSGLDMWHAGEAGKYQFQRARNTLSMIRDDLTAMVTNDYLHDGSEVDVRLLADLQKINGSEDKVQRIRFVRRITDELQHNLLRSAGEYNFTKAPTGPVQFDMYNNVDDTSQFQNRTLANSGGMMEVGYMMRGEELYRAVLAPIGYYYADGGVNKPISLFDGPLFFSNLDINGDPDDGILTSNAAPIAGNVLHFEMRFWAPESESWEITEPVRQDVDASWTWDSTRRETNTPEDIPFGDDYAGARVGDPEDDVFPSKVKVILVMDTDRKSRKLTRVVNAAAGIIRCEDTRGFIQGEPARQYIKIENEWLRYSKLENDEFTIDQNGARFTDAVPHAKGVEVYQGQMFSMIIDIPGIVNE